MTTQPGSEGRADPFGDLSDFVAKPKPLPKPVEPDQIERLAAENNFPSRQPQVAREKPARVAAPAPHPVRRFTTGRNKQLNLKATDETIERFYRLADEKGVPLAECFEQAVAALEAAMAKKGG